MDLDRGLAITTIAREVIASINRERNLAVDRTRDTRLLKTLVTESGNWRRRLKSRAIRIWNGGPNRASYLDEYPMPLVWTSEVNRALDRAKEAYLEASLADRESPTLEQGLAARDVVIEYVEEPRKYIIHNISHESKWYLIYIIILAPLQASPFNIEKLT